MSIKVMTKVWELDIPSQEKLLLLALADWADDEGGRIYPSVAAMTRKSRVPERSVQRYLKRFRDRGLLVLEQAAAQHKPAHYRIDVSRLDVQAAADNHRGDTVAPLTASRGATVAPLESPGVPNRASRGAKSSIQGCQSLAPNPLVLEPLENHHTYAHEGFDAFWLAYPRKAGKQAAREEWRKLRPTPHLRDRLMAALRSQAAAGHWWRDDDGRMAGLHASTWLHQHRWEDDAVPLAPPPKRRELPDGPKYRDLSSF